VYGLQVSWLGETKQLSKPGVPDTADGRHHVVFALKVQESVFVSERSDRVNFPTRLGTVLTLMLSAIGIMRVVKALLELLIDVCLVRRARKTGQVTPPDVDRRLYILNEKFLTETADLDHHQNETTGRLSSFRQPKKQRRLSSRELMQQKKSKTTVDSNVVADIELAIKNGDRDARVFNNPMKKNKRQTSSADGDVELKKEIAALKKEMQNMKKQTEKEVQDMKKQTEKEMQDMKKQTEKEMREIKKQMALMQSGAVPSSKSVAKTTPKTKNKKWKSAKNKLKSVSALKQRRRSSLLTSSAEVDLTSSVNIHVDEATGQKYSVNALTGASEWLDESAEVEDAVHVDPASGRRYNSKGWL
jgi:hypothetical protein